LHFGLGKATRIDRIDVRWPSGRRESLVDVAVNRIIRVREGEGIVG
jgi:hypothetical protein